MSFAKNLRELHWNPHVVSVKNPDKFYCLLGSADPPRGIPVDYTYSLLNLFRIFGLINGLLTRLAHLAGFRIERNYLYDVFCIPDGFVGWIPVTLFKCFRIINKKDIDYVFVSCKPFSAAIIGLIIKKIKKIPVILDFRDPYSLDVEEIDEKSKRPWWRKKIDQFIEKKLFEQSDIIINVSKEITTTYKRMYSEIAGRFFTIYNGFDKDHFPITKNIEKFKRFTIVYAGNFYYLNAQEPFFEALHKMKSEGRIQAEHFEFLYFGESGGRILEQAIQYDIEDLVSINERIPYDRMLAVLARSHLHYIRVTQYAVPSKVHDGLALGVPFIGWVPYPEVREIIDYYSPKSYIFSENTKENYIRAIKNSLKYNIKINDSNKLLKQQFINDFSREKAAKKLSEIIEDIV